MDENLAEDNLIFKNSSPFFIRKNEKKKKTQLVFKKRNAKASNLIVLVDLKRKKNQHCLQPGISRLYPTPRKKIMTQILLFLTDLNKICYKNNRICYEFEFVRQIRHCI
jgi:hypothetical protein